MKHCWSSRRGNRLRGGGENTNGEREGDGFRERLTGTEGEDSGGNTEARLERLKTCWGTSIRTTSSTQKGRLSNQTASLSQRFLTNINVFISIILLCFLLLVLLFILLTALLAFLVPFPPSQCLFYRSSRTISSLVLRLSVKPVLVYWKNTGLSMSKKPESKSYKTTLRFN